VPVLTELIDHLDRLLAIDAFPDYCPNGLQVPGGSNIQTVVTGVSAHGRFLEEAAAAGAELVIVHHGLFWKGDPLGLTPALYRRLKILFERDIALAAYHLPLDAHPELGNNALLARGLEGLDLEPFAEIGVRVHFDGNGLSLDELVARVTRVVGGREPVVVAGGGERRVRTLGIVSGGAADSINEAAAQGLDAFLTGEPVERAFGLAVDNGIHFLAAGHHATETFGVRALGELLEREFGVRHVFVDVPNPI
jgi:dinuclear metal center YbgI/SA1388 family protein